MGTAELALRVVLAAVFLTAAIGKLLDLSGSRKALSNFGVPPVAASRLALVLPCAELATSVALIIRPTARAGAIAALVLMLAFTGAVARALAREQRPECHCFGLFHSAPAGWDTVVRNLALGIVALVVVVAGSGPALDGWIGDRSAAELSAIGIGLFAAALAFIALRSRRELAEVRHELGTAKAALNAVPPGLPVGALAPGFELEEARGGTISLRSLCDRGLPVLLVFAGRGCGPSWELEAELPRWQSALSNQLTIALASHGRPEENHWQSEQLGIVDIALQPEYELLRAYRVRGTPSAVLISPGGRIASVLAQGSDAIEALVRATLRRQRHVAMTLEPA